VRGTLRLGDHCLKIGSGATPRGGKDAYLAQGPYSLIRSQNVLNERFSIGGLAFISQEQADQLSNVEVQSSDVLLNITGDSVARVCQVDPMVLPARVNQHVAIIRPKPEVIDPRFLRYFMVSPEMQAHMLGLAASGATRNALTKGMIEKFEIPAVPLPEQRAIAATLGALDDKIELNRKMNATLEAMARALFRDWFVDFGPTRAKMESRAPYLSPDLWSLFPDRLDAEGKPEGWEVSTIGDEVRVVGGSTPSTKEPDLWDGGINWATPKDLSNLVAPVLLETSRTISQAGLAKISSGLLPVGALLLSSRAPIGYLAIAELPVSINQGFIGMICDKRVSNVFAWLWTLENMEAILAKANGSTFQEISKGNFRPLPVVVSPEPVLRAFDAIATPLYERIAKNERESRTLAQTRDLLLPRLMSGELRVAEAESLASAVA